MKKIVICIPTLATAGAERFVVDLASNLDKSKYKVYVAITRVNVIGPFGEILKKENVEIINLVGKNFLDSTKKQIAFFKRVKPDVVHANIGSLFHIMVATKISKIRKRIYTIHNEAKLLYGESKLKKICFRLAFSFFGFLPVAICDTVKKSMIKEFGTKYNNIPCINNGVDIVKYRPIYEKNENDTITIVNTGTMYWIKNQKEIISAFANLYNKYKNIRLIILGDGEKRQKLENLVNENEISNVVSMPGICSNVNEYLQSSDIYISASLTEGLPLSMLEAMACGLPIITSAAGGSIDLVKTGVNGIVYEKNNQKELENAIEQLLLDSKLRRQYAKKSRSIAEEWSIENCASGYEKLYME